MGFCWIEWDLMEEAYVLWKVISGMNGKNDDILLTSKSVEEGGSSFCVFFSKMDSKAICVKAAEK